MSEEGKSESSAQPNRHIPKQFTLVLKSVGSEFEPPHTPRWYCWWPRDPTGLGEAPSDIGLRLAEE